MFAARYLSGFLFVAAPLFAAGVAPCTSGANNEKIDADLAREYGSIHEEEQ